MKGKGIDLGKLIAEADSLYPEARRRNPPNSVTFTTQQDIEIMVHMEKSIRSRFAQLFRKRYGFGSRDSLTKRYNYLKEKFETVDKYDPELVDELTPSGY